MNLPDTLDWLTIVVAAVTVGLLLRGIVDRLDRIAVAAEQTRDDTRELIDGLRREASQ